MTNDKLIAAHHAVEQEADKDELIASLRQVVEDLTAERDKLLAKVRECKRLAVAGNMVAMQMQQVERDRDAARAELARVRDALLWQAEKGNQMADAELIADAKAQQKDERK